MKRIQLACCLAALLLGASRESQAEQANTLSDAEKRAGWQLLFDGKSMDAWRNYRKESVGDGWAIEDGAIVRKDKGAGDIITRKQYDSFELTLDYRISPGGNSGLMFHVTEEEATPWRTGPEIQIQDNVDGHDPQKAGWLYQLYPAPVDATKPAGEWNTLRVLISPGGSVIYMNGIRYARFKKGSDDWNRKVAASKFAKFPGFGKADTGHICLQDHGNLVAFRNIKIRELAGEGTAPNPVDGQLPYRAVLAFPKLQWTGWSQVSEEGKVQPLRPIVITNAADGSNRLFVATQRGVIHAFDNRPDVEKTSVFLDISDRVSYDDRQNEEGLLGFAFHPQYKTNGEFFIYYTTKKEPHVSIISRFKVSSDDPNRAMAASEEEVLRIPQPYWNHNGGTIAFGPDGYLYVGLGDGGAGNDPHKNAQNLGTLLGSILRIDVNTKSADRAYGIPADNPFVNRDGARPEIYAYGLRNIWRMAFDRETGHLWASDVGQNLWEEINIVRKGGNYGWNLREAAHPFGQDGVDARDDLIEPIWEYDHEVGKSITGGNVYRGKKLPGLAGHYLYGDYVTGRLWALNYDSAAGNLVGNYALHSDEPLAVISYGEDEAGEVYLSIVATDGRGIYKFEKVE